MEYIDQNIYLLYDTESPLARILSDAWISVLAHRSTTTIREFKNPPQPLYRGGLINPDNPHLVQQNRIITAHNINENKRVWLDHHEVYQTKMAPGQKRDPELSDTLGWQSMEQNPQSSDTLQAAPLQKELIEIIDPQIEDIKNALTSLPAWSIVILVQSTNFRLSTFRIRLELFHLGIHVVEFNHLAYIPESEFTTFTTSLSYQTDEYMRQEWIMRWLIEENNAKWRNTRIQSVNGEFLTFWALEKIRGNTGDYTGTANKGGTFPLGEVFTESVELDSLNGKCLIESYPRDDFSVDHCTPFELVIQNGRVLPSLDFPAPFAKLYSWIVEYEWEVMVRELGMGLNRAITTTTPLSDINFYERKIGIHLSLGKKHGIYGKKLPKTMIQRFHIDVFIATEWVYIWDQRVYEDGGWTI
jgi:aminopeptidase